MQEPKKQQLAAFMAVILIHVFLIASLAEAQIILLDSSRQVVSTLDPGDDDEIFLYDGTNVIQLTDNDYDDERRRVIGAFTSYNNKEDGAFATAPVAGDAITLEYYEPAAVRGQGVISIWRVVHAYRNLFGFADNPSDLRLGPGDLNRANDGERVTAIADRR